MNIFIEYGHKDEARVDQVAEKLQAFGHTVFKVSDVNPDEETPSEILDVYEKAEMVLLVLSAETMHMNTKEVWLTYLNYFGGTFDSRKLYVLTFDKIDMSEIPPMMFSNVYIDLSENFDKQLETFAKFASKLESGEQASPPPEILIKRPDNINDLYIENLQDAFHDGALSLVCGAGVSVSAGIPTWNNLIEDLLDRMISQLALNIENPIKASDFLSYYNQSPIILGKSLKNHFGSFFNEELRAALYKGGNGTCDLIREIAMLSKPSRRNGCSLDSIITFNFDGLIEEELQKLRVDFKPIYNDGVRFNPNELPIYHVHGYLPRTGEIPEDTELVFSEDSYHNKTMDVYSWSNIIQLIKYSQNTCLFLGLSLTDPNLRRLLDVSNRKNINHEKKHYLIMKDKNSADISGEVFEISKNLETQDFNELGLNVLWVEEYQDIPKLLGKIRE